MFLNGISSKEVKNKELLSAMMNLGKNLGYSIIAEGIEHQEQADHLLALGCYYGQGYLYGKPMPMEEFVAYARKHSPHVLLLSAPADSPKQHPEPAHS